PGAARAASQREMRDRRDTGQRLAAETERGNPLEVVGTANLAGRMALDGEPRILRRHAFAVVFDLDQLLAAKLHRDDDPARARVDRVLDELFDHGCRTLDDFSGGNLV